jgi:hypothetical protein
MHCCSRVQQHKLHRLQHSTPLGPPISRHCCRSRSGSAGALLQQWDGSLQHAAAQQQRPAAVAQQQQVQVSQGIISAEVAVLDLWTQ